MDFLAIIPARYASTRFPGKPLARLGGKYIIERVCERVAQAFDNVVVATDDERIKEAVASFGGQAVMTSSNHRSGTDRCEEAVQIYEAKGYAPDVVVNIQGDEPFIDKSQLEAIKGCFDNPRTQIATLVQPFRSDASPEMLTIPSSPKVVVDNEGFAMYFSRSVIPYYRGVELSDWLKKHTYYKHIGLYAYRRDVLRQITRLEQSSLELAESLEQLRWLQNGYKIKVATTNVETIGIDTPEDLERAEAFLNKH